jgi:hypothetical protein
MFGGVFVTHLVPFGSMLVTMSSALALAVTYSTVPFSVAVTVVASGLAEVESPVGAVLAGIGTGREAKLFHDLTESQSQTIVIGRCSLYADDGERCQGGRYDRGRREMHGE